jgi:hypothetical protein
MIIFRVDEDFSLHVEPSKVNPELQVKQFVASKQLAHAAGQLVQ